MDTTTGHWEMMGIVTARPFPTYPDGFPDEILAAFSQATGRGVLGNVAASGTEIIQRLGAEHERTGSWIVYTSADSVFQIAAHEGVVPLEELYEACRTARGILTGEHAVGRVIARPFEGSAGAYRRTPHRHDFSLEPPRPNHLQRLREAGITVHGVGKISDIFAGCDVDTSRPTESNAQGIAATEELMRTAADGSLVFTNLVETDMLWGHRNDPRGFADALEEFDAGLPGILAAMRHGDLLVLTSDHGCDPTTASTDHSREHGLLVAHVPGMPLIGRRHDGDTFADVGATVMRVLTGSVPADLPGASVV
jgi:phosphopentomutase